jgi:PPM family protein phosphatase
MVSAHAVSDAGPVRKNNEDSCVVDHDLRVFAVADGMGGHSAGEVASRLAIDALVGFLRRTDGMSEDVSWPYGIDPALSFDANRLRTAVHLANRRVFRAAESHDDYTGMGTTMVSVLVSGGRVVVASVGDSRAYLLAGGQLMRLTRDDTWAATVLAHQGADADPVALAAHPMRHVLTNVLGAREDISTQLGEHELHGGERLLLCSDGLHGVVDDHRLQAILEAAPDAREAADQLVRAALEAGTRDNVTALVVRYEGSR